MIIQSLDDLRAVIIEMAKRRRTTIHGLEVMGNVAKGAVNRFMNTFVLSRRKDEGKVKILTDLRFQTVLKLVEGADYELIIQPKQRKNRREQILDAARAANGGRADEAAS